MTMTYAEKLQDPRWQRKRLEIMQRADFKCEACGRGDETLHVHHGYYEKDFEPWDYDNDTLWCLCRGCHSLVGDQMNDVRKEIAKLHPSNIGRLMLWVKLVQSETRQPGD